jgi:hypothetical protein
MGGREGRVRGLENSQMKEDGARKSVLAEY